MTPQVHTDLRELARLTSRRPRPPPHAAAPALASASRRTIDAALAMYSYTARRIARRHNLLQLPRSERQVRRQRVREGQNPVLGGRSTLRCGAMALMLL